MRRRIDPRREDGVAMTEFALILPVFMLIVVGMLVFGRLLFYWIETNHVANETARWAVVDRNPTGLATLQLSAKTARDEGVRRQRRRVHRLPGQELRDRRARRSRAGPRAGARQLHQVLRLGRDDQGLVDDAPRADRRQRSTRSGRSPIPPRTSGRAREPTAEGGARRHPRAERAADPGLHRDDGDDRRRRAVVHAQAPAAEPRRRRRLRGRHRVREELEGVRPDRRPRAQGEHGARDREQGPPVRRQSRGDRLRARTRSPATLYNANIATQSKLDVVINSTTYTDDNDYNDDNGSTTPVDPELGDPCFVHTAGTDNISPGGGQWTDVRVKENDLPSLFGAIGLPLRRNVARARIEIRPALSQKGFLPLAVPNTIVRRCRSGTSTSAATRRHYRRSDSRPLRRSRTPTSAGYAAQGGGTLWAPASAIPPPPAQPVGDPSR